MDDFERWIFKNMFQYIEYIVGVLCIVSIFFTFVIIVHKFIYWQPITTFDMRLLLTTLIIPLFVLIMYIRTNDEY